MSTMRRMARTVARNKSYNESHTTNMFEYYFEKLWRGKHPKNINSFGSPGPTKKGHRPLCIKK